MKRVTLSWRPHPEIGQAIIAEWRYRRFEIRYAMDINQWYVAEVTPQPWNGYEPTLPETLRPTLWEAVDYVEEQITELGNAPARIAIADFLEARQGLLKTRAV